MTAALTGTPTLLTPVTTGSSTDLSGDAAPFAAVLGSLAQGEGKAGGGGGGGADGIGHGTGEPSGELGGELPTGVAVPRLGSHASGAPIRWTQPRSSRGDDPATPTGPDASAGPALPITPAVPITPVVPADSPAPAASATPSTTSSTTPSGSLSPSGSVLQAPTAPLPSPYAASPPAASPPAASSAAGAFQAMAAGPVTSAPSVTADRPPTAAASASDPASSAERPSAAPARAALVACYRIREHATSDEKGVPGAAAASTAFDVPTDQVASTQVASTQLAPSAGLAPASPAAAVAPSTPVTAATSTALPEAPQPALASALAQLRRGPDGIHELEVTLHPADLGTVQVRVAMHQGALDVTVACAHQAARDAVTAALPLLHRDLAGLGSVELTGPRHTPDTRPDADAQHGRRDPGAQDDAPRQHRPNHRRDSDSDTFDRWM